ncbi:hypothetical protein DVH26_19235 [Paenibacillus sp. H1-7]|uniref:hypothetical protein n=1 Tax=Paenibacillus sp. H1-7 TaxID=2282849 RepID=UPI001EF75BCB|nr:hypothetical protein [Paenibacillus sp. H1-7]ULL16391.1 hypothetical protein DVH26_19235 [Paenibacillus sp. H1-7]
MDKEIPTIRAGQGVDSYELGWHKDKLLTVLDQDYTLTDALDCLIYDKPNIRFFVAKCDMTLHSIYVYNNFIGRFLDKYEINTPFQHLEKDFSSTLEYDEMDSYYSLGDYPDILIYTDSRNENVANISGFQIFKMDFTPL